MTGVVNDINLIYSPTPETAGSPAAYLNQIRRWLTFVSLQNKTLDPREWTLTGDSKEEALMYSAFEGGEASDAALAVIRTRKN